jgi:hypothetical protein
MILFRLDLAGQSQSLSSPSTCILVLVCDCRICGDCAM